MNKIKLEGYEIAFACDDNQGNDCFGNLKIKIERGSFCFSKAMF